MYDELVNKAREAMKNAYIPYSKFPVGACVLTNDGHYIPGCNIENAAYGSTMCAERNAVFGAYVQGYRKEDIKAIAIVGKGKNIISPCGACRQVLSELLDPLTPVVLANDTKQEVTNMKELLPKMFLEEDLDV